MPNVYILLPVHNRKEITRDFVDGLATQTFTSCHLVLIDDGSTDGTAEMVLARIPSTTVLRGRGDWWWAGSLQQGIDWLRTQSLAANDVVLFVNDDSVMPHDFLELGYKLLQDAPNSMLQACVHDRHTGAVLDVGMVFDAEHLQFHSPAPGERINCLTTNGLFVRWGDLQRVGNFHPRLLPHYLSDYEFTIRAGRKGLAMVVMRQLSLNWNQQTTGYHSFTQRSIVSFLKAYFSRKSASNPLAWTSFVFMTCPWRYSLRHVWRIWRSALIMIGSKFIEMMKPGVLHRDSQEK